MPTQFKVGDKVYYRYPDTRLGFELDPNTVFTVTKDHGCSYWPLDIVGPDGERFPVSHEELEAANA